jgi:hypothetical protein
MTDVEERSCVFGAPRGTGQRLVRWLGKEPSDTIMPVRTCRRLRLQGKRRRVLNSVCSFVRLQHAGRDTAAV